MRRVAWSLGALLFLLLAVAEWAAGETIRHSGTIVAVDKESALEIVVTVVGEP